VAEHVRFAVSDASDSAVAGGYHLVTILEARRRLRDGGSVLVADERVDDEFTAPAPVLERHAYGWSVISCLPSAMGDPLTAATGAVMRPSTLRRYATAAGFNEIEVLAIETGRFASTG
jgi:hypothetical protein